MFPSKNSVLEFFIKYFLEFVLELFEYPSYKLNNSHFHTVMQVCFQLTLCVSDDAGLGQFLPGQHRPAVSSDYFPADCRLCSANLHQHPRDWRLHHHPLLLRGHLCQQLPLRTAALLLECPTGQKKQLNCKKTN